MVAKTSADITKLIYNRDNIMSLNIIILKSFELKNADWYRVYPDMYHVSRQCPEDEKI